VQQLGAILGGSFVLASLVVGLRLLVLGIRTGEAPGRLIGSGLLLSSVVGYPMMAVSRNAVALPADTRALLAGCAAAALTVGTLLIAGFVQKVFREGSPVAAAVLGALALAMIGMFVGQSLGAGWATWAATGKVGAWSGARLGLLVPSAWGAGESLRYHWLLKRRLALGLIDPISVDRFRLFGVSMAAGCTTAVATIVCQLLGLEILGTPVGALVLSPVPIAAVALWLAFLPPRAYLDRIEAAHARSVA
jgi:hypothetical protein